MVDTEDMASDIAVMSPEEYAALMVRVVLGTLYVSHPLLMGSIFGLDHAAHYLASIALPASAAYAIAAAELAGGAMLLFGLHVRPVAIGLLPVALGAAAVHLGTGLGAGFTYGAYLAACLAGQALLASGCLQPRPEAGEGNPLFQGAS